MASRSNFFTALIIGVLSSILVGTAFAGTIEVTIVDRDGRPVPGIAVFAETGSTGTTGSAVGKTAVMDQYNKRFVPHMLIVQAGTSVEFPNSDSIAHHVYSFSHPNQFKLPIYKGDAYPPITFSQSGVVTLGCNIHDNMLGYILVVDTPVFGMTDEDGRVLLSTDTAADARVSVWSPRIRDNLEELSVRVQSSDLPSKLTVQLEKSLREPHEAPADSLDWADY